MEITLEQGKNALKQLAEIIRQYKFVIIILLLGIVLMCVPLHSQEQTSPKVDMKEANTEDNMEEKLEKILSLIEGAGDVHVLLSIQTGAAHIYQTDTEKKTASDTEDVHEQTVLVSSGGDEIPLEVMVTYPTYKGAVVVCEGADRAAVKLAVVQAVCTATGLGSDRVSVIKMNEN